MSRPSPESPPTPPSEGGARPGKGPIPGSIPRPGPGPVSTPDPDPVPIPVERLQAIPFLQQLSSQELLRVARMGRRMEFPRGDLLIREGDPGSGLYVIVEGEVEVVRRGEGPESVLGFHGPGAFLGELSLLEGVPAAATVRATRRCEVLVLAPDDFQALLATSPGACLSVLRTALERLRSAEAALIQREKLASLGTLAGGLAHQVNNPAAAIRRGAVQLQEALDRWETGTARLGHELGGGAPLVRLRERIRARGGEEVEPTLPSLSGLGRVDQERELAGWMAARAVDDPTTLAAELVASGWTLSRLQEVFPELADSRRPGKSPPEESMFHWLADRGDVQGILEAVAASAETISRVVEAIRGYARVDVAPVREVELGESLRHALAILRGRIPPAIRVNWDLPQEPIHVPARGSELTHVWVNLLENALDAMGTEGTLTLGVRRRGDGVEVEVGDTGPGIPGPLQDRIFDPFFTTRMSGGGTGLGLHVARGIVLNQHRGRIEVDSVPGATVFRVSLPAQGPNG
jgi:signal transduction histidine kinase